MKTLLNVKVTLRQAKKGNITQVSTSFNPDSFEFPLKIVARSYNGKSRGTVGYINRDGDLKLIRTLRGFTKIDPVSFTKISFILDMMKQAKQYTLCSKDTLMLINK